MKEFILEFLAPAIATITGILLIIILLIIVPAMTFQNYIDKQSCEQIATANNIQHQYRWTSGCLLSINGKMIPLENYKNIDVRKGN
jgi:hypothetical protein